LCKGLSDKEKKELGEELKIRKPRNLQEWEMMLDAFGNCEYPIEDAYFEGTEQSSVDYKDILRVYNKYSDNDIRGYVEDKIAAAYAVTPEESELVDVVKEICRLNKDFKIRIYGSLADRLLSRKGAFLAWLLAFANFILVIVLVSILVSGGREQSVMMEDDVVITVIDSTDVAQEVLMEEKDSEINRE
jgi:hypothetical protein